MKTLQYNTNRLFYNKWTYKTIIQVKRNWSSNLRLPDGIPTCRELKCALDQKIDRKLYSLRTEGQRSSVFCKDKEVFNTIKSLFPNFVVATYEPENTQHEDILTGQSRRKVLCKKLPWQSYQFKFYFNNYMNTEMKLSFWEWTQRYKKKIQLTHSTIDWLKSHSFQSSYYGYAVDESMMSMICLYLGNNIRYIEEYVPVDDINSKL